MKQKRISLIVSILLLILLSACEMGTAVPPPPSPPPPPPTSVPATPLTKNNNPGPAAGIANNPNPGSIIPPVCDVPAPTMGQVTSFCANQVAGLGGVTFDPYTQLLPNSNDGSFYASIPSNVNCTQDQKTNHVACSGPPGTSFQVMVCNTCGVIQPQGSVICAFGRTANPPNGCFPSSPEDTHNGQVPVCLPGTHYDNNKQNCVDDVTGQLVSACPSGYPYYNPEYYTCSSKSNQGIFNCQTFTVPLGECLTSVKKVPGTGPCKINPMTGKC